MDFHRQKSCPGPLSAYLLRSITGASEIDVLSDTPPCVSMLLCSTGRASAHTGSSLLGSAALGSLGYHFPHTPQSQQCSVNLQLCD